MKYVIDLPDDKVTWILHENGLICLDPREIEKEIEKEGIYYFNDGIVCVEIAKCDELSYTQEQIHDIAKRMFLDYFNKEFENYFKNYYVNKGKLK